MIQPIILHNVTLILVRDFGVEPKQAAQFAAKFIDELQRHDLDIVRGIWNKPDEETGRGLTWKDLQDVAKSAEAVWGDRRPWNPPELR